MKANFTINIKENTAILNCSGSWIIDHIGKASNELQKFNFTSYDKIILHTQEIETLDTSGAWLFANLMKQKKQVVFENYNSQHKNLIDAMLAVQQTAEHNEKLESGDNVLPKNIIKNIAQNISSDIILALHILGESLTSIFKLSKRTDKNKIRLTSIVHQFDIMALRAVGVITVMAFLIGGVIAQQGAFLLRVYGESLLAVNLVGILHLREIGVMITAIMVSGRTGSSITAEFGTMKMREEMDALAVMGFNAISVLILPRLIALVIAVPILTMLANLSGLFGAMVVSYYYSDINPTQFMVTLHSAIDLSTVFAGLLKTPFMAIAIALIAFVEGLKVDGSAESLGLRTTICVVRCIFAVVVIDCLFALFYATIGF